MEVLPKRGLNVCLKQEAFIGRLVLMLCLDGSVTLFTLGGVDLLDGKKFKMARSEPTSVLLRRRLKSSYSTVQNARGVLGAS